MTNNRIFLLSFLAVSWFFLSGLNKPINTDMSVVDRQKTDVELESFATERDLKLLETKQVKAKSDVKPVKSSKQDTQQTTTKVTNAGVANENNPIERKFECLLSLYIQKLFHLLFQCFLLSQLSHFVLKHNLLLSLFVPLFNYFSIKQHWIHHVFVVIFNIIHNYIMYPNILYFNYNFI